MLGGRFERCSDGRRLVRFFVTESEEDAVSPVTGALLVNAALALTLRLRPNSDLARCWPPLR